MSNPKPSDHLKSPSSVWLIWNGPADQRHILCATTTEDAAHLEIGRRVASGEGAPIQNPRPEEIPVIGDPDPKSIDAMLGRVTTGIQDAVKTFTGPDSPFRHL